MSEYTKHQHGTFCWLDLATTDTTAAKQFYSEIFGWEIFDIPVGENMVYTMLSLNGKPVAALSEMQAEQRAMNIPSHWMSYVSVDNADEIMASVIDNGGTVVLPVIDVMEEGRMGLLQDPEGAYLGIWQPKNMPGFYYKDTPGAVCWFEHGSHDKSKSIPFLEKTFGWTSSTNTMGEMIYTTFFLGEVMVGGLYEMTPDMTHIPSHWLPYFGIANIDQTLEKISSLNGKILMPKMFVQGVGHFAVVSDPQGGVFGLLQG
jgi:hypothetical protein